MVRVQHVAARLRPEEAGEGGERDEALLRARLERGPAASMLFRPEEVHACSEKRRPASRGAEPIVEVADHPGWVDPDDTTVAHFDRDRVAAVQARGIDEDRLAGEPPGARRRLESAT